MTSKFKPGDTLRVLTLEELRQKYGTTPDGEINIVPSFDRGKYYLCGQVFTVKDVQVRHSNRYNVDFINYTSKERMEKFNHLTFWLPENILAQCPDIDMSVFETILEAR